MPYDPAILLLDLYPDKTIIQNDTCTPMFIAALVTTVEKWKQPKCPMTDEWIKKTCTHMQQNTTYHKNNVIYSYMDEPRTYHTK